MTIRLCETPGCPHQTMTPGHKRCGAHNAGVKPVGRSCSTSGCSEPATRQPTGQLNKRCATHRWRKQPDRPCSWQGCSEPATLELKRCPEHRGNRMPPRLCSWEGCDRPTTRQPSGQSNQRCEEHAAHRVAGNPHWHSAVEDRLCAALDVAGVEYTRQAYLPGLRHAYDIRIDSATLLIEVDGCRWHCCPDHPKQWADRQFDEVFAQRRRDAMASAHALEAGWVLQRLWEHTVNDDDSLRAFIATLRSQ